MKNGILACFVFLLLSIESGFAQVGTYDVLQTQKGSVLNSFETLTDNPILQRVIQKRKGLEFILVNGNTTFKEWDDIETVNFGYNEYHLDAAFNDLSISLLYKPYPYTSSEQRLQTGIIKVSGLVEEKPEEITFYKVIFQEDLVIK